MLAFHFLYMIGTGFATLFLEYDFAYLFENDLQDL